jgi:hypothetical protein
MSNLLVNAVATWNGKALQKGQKQITGFDKSVKKLGKTFAGVFAAQKLLGYGKASVKAFAADDKAAKVLAKSLDNLGLSYANPQIKDFISTLEAQFGVLDDQLRPAFQKLVTTTGDWRQSQDLLKTALDLSALSGGDVVSVAADLSKAYAGNTRGLLKYGLGLSKTQLAAMSFEDILKQVAKVSAGQATVAADSYAGKLDKLTVAAENAKETIGKGLLQAMTELGGANGFEGALKGIDAFAQGISDAIVKLTRLATIAGFFIYNKKGTNPFTQTREFNEANAKSDMLARRQFGGAAANKYMAEADKAAALKLKKAKADELSMLSAKNKLTKEEAQMKKDQAALDKLKEKFDLERIGLNAALNQATDEETKARIRAQIAILDETGKTAQAANDALVKAQKDKVDAEIKAGDALVYLATSAGKASGGIITWLSALEYSRERFGNAGATKPFVGGSPLMPGDNSGAIGAQGGGTTTDSQKRAGEIFGADTNIPVIPVPIYVAGSGGGAGQGEGQVPAGAISVTVNTGPSMADENTIVDAVQMALNEIARRGYLTTYAGALPA